MGSKQWNLSTRVNFSQPGQRVSMLKPPGFNPKSKTLKVVRLAVMKTDPAAEIDSQNLNSTVRDVASNCVRQCFKGSCWSSMKFMSKQVDWSNGPIYDEFAGVNLFGQEIAVYLTVRKASNHFSRCISPFSQSAQPGRWLPPASLLRFCWEESQHCSLRGSAKTWFECESGVGLWNEQNKWGTKFSG